jgi:hypothetical protein
MLFLIPNLLAGWTLGQLGQMLFHAMLVQNNVAAATSNALLK